MITDSSIRSYHCTIKVSGFQARCMKSDFIEKKSLSIKIVGAKFHLELAQSEQDATAKQALLDRADFEGRVVTLMLLEVVAVCLILLLSEFNVERIESFRVARN